MMTHAVLRQMEMYGGSGNLVLRKKKGRGKQLKPKKPKAAEGAGGEDGGGGADGADGGGGGGGGGADGGEGAEGAEGAEGGDGADAATAWQEEAFDFEKNLHDFAANRTVLEKYVGLLRAFDEVEPQVTHGVLRLLARLITQCKLEPMLFQVGVLQVFLEVLEL